MRRRVSFSKSKKKRTSHNGDWLVCANLDSVLPAITYFERGSQTSSWLSTLALGSVSITAMIRRPEGASFWCGKSRISIRKPVLVFSMVALGNLAACRKRRAAPVFRAASSGGDGSGLYATADESGLKAEP